MEGNLTQGNLINIGKSIGIVLIITLIIVGIICYIAQWRDPETYSKGIMYVGFLYILLGILTIKAAIESRANFGYGKENDNSKLMGLKDYSVEFLIIMTGLGILLIIISLIIKGIV